MKHVIAQSQRRKTVFGIIFVVEIEEKTGNMVTKTQVS